MRLELFRKPFAALCIVLVSSSYAASVPAVLQSIDQRASSSAYAETPNPKPDIKASHASISSAAPGCLLVNNLSGSQQDDSDIKEAREEDAPVRDARPVRQSKPL
ncbi:hypothetical protein [Acinetobacter sp.]|uniref:hypothetical protein n=1 Tax=Acinetobacter sp. TaxID=472 RepID=UPI0035B24113